MIFLQNFSDKNIFRHFRKNFSTHYIPKSYAKETSFMDLLLNSQIFQWTFNLSLAITVHGLARNNECRKITMEVKMAPRWPHNAMQAKPIWAMTALKKTDKVHLGHVIEKIQINHISNYELLLGLKRKRPGPQVFFYQKLLSGYA